MRHHQHDLCAASAMRAWRCAAATLLVLLPGLAGAAPMAWIPNSGSDNVRAVDTETDSASGAPVTIAFNITMPGDMPPSDILVGNNDGSVRGFGPDADGNAAPYRALTDASTGMQWPYAMVYESKEDVVYVGDFYASSVRVFAVGTNGNSVPLRVLDSPALQQIKGIAVDSVNDEIVLNAGFCFACAFPRTASGNAARLRGLGWGGNTATQLNSPSSLAVNPAQNEIYIADSDFGSSTTPNLGKVFTFARTADGDVAPLRVLQGALTRIDQGTPVIAFDPDSQLLFVLTSTTDTPNHIKHGRILVFPANASGNVAPLRVIEGAATGLDTAINTYFYGMSFDAANQRLLVSINSNNTPAANMVLVFATGDSGDVAPLLALGGASTGMSSIGAAIAVPDRILRDGFERR